MEELAKQLFNLDMISRGILIVVFIIVMFIQRGIIRAEKKDLRFIRSFVEGLKELSKETKKLYEEREKMIKEKTEEEKEEEIKKATKKAALDGVRIGVLEGAQKAAIQLGEEIADLTFVIYKISLFTGAPPMFETYINKMKEGAGKTQAMRLYNRAKKEIKGIGADQLMALFLRSPELLEKKEKSE